MKVQRLSRIVMLSALAIVLRMAFGAFPNIKPLTAMFLISLFYLPLVDSVLIMTLTMVGSGLLFGMSPVIFWQVVAYCIIMLVWYGSVRPFEKWGRLPVWVGAVCAGLGAFLYGFLISLPTSIQFGSDFFPYWVHGLSFDLLHAVSTFLFYPFIDSIFRRLYHEEN